MVNRKLWEWLIAVFRKRTMTFNIIRVALPARVYHHVPAETSSLQT